MAPMDKSKLLAEAEEAQKALAASSESREDLPKLNFYKSHEGENEIRVVEANCEKTATHWNVGPGNVTINAPVGEDGRIGGWLQKHAAELADAAEESGDEADALVASKLFARRAWLYNIVDPNDPDKGVQVFSAPLTVHAQLIKYLADKDEKYGDITDLDAGYNVFFTVTNAGKKEAKYTGIECDRRATALSDELKAAVAKGLPDLTKIRPGVSDEELQAAFYGTSVDAEAPSEEAAEPTVVRKVQPTAEVVPEEEAPTTATPKRQFGSTLRNKA